MIKGIDISIYDRELNWAQYTWNFAYIKVSEGMFEDPDFRTHWNGAKGFTYRGGYHFFRHLSDPKDSALKCIEIMNGDLGELPLWFDLEETSTSMSTRREIVTKAKSWLSWFEQETGIRPIIYTSFKYIFELGAAADISWMRNYKLALAQYPYDNFSDATRAQIIHKIITEQVAYLIPNPLSPFLKTTMTQWTSRGAPEDVPGYYTGPDGKKAVDFNFYNGDESDFKEEFNLGPLTPPTIPDPPPTGGSMIGKVIVNTLNIRTGTSTTHTAIGQLRLNDIVEADYKDNGWWHLTSITRGNTSIPLPGPQNFAFEGATQGYIQTLPDPTPGDDHLVITLNDVVLLEMFGRSRGG